MVVVALERVDVGVEDGESLVVGKAARDLAQDVGVAAHPGQRAQAPRRLRARHHRAKAGDELLGDERFRDVVVGAAEKVLDLVLQRVADGEEHDRDETGPEVFAKLGHYLVAGRLAEHEVEQDDVRPPLDRRRMREESVAHGHALKAGALEDAFDQAQDLLVVVDDESDVAPDQSRARTVRGRHGHVVLGSGRGILSVSAIARSAAERTSRMSVFTASGSLASSAMRSL